jgi:hypothetical protein
VAVEIARQTPERLRLLKSLGPLPGPVAKPYLIAVSGLPGTGKSYFCSRLLERLPAALLESDALRKTLFPTPTYSAIESGRLFRLIREIAEDLLSRSIPVVWDATNLTESERHYLYGIADRLRVKLVLVRVSAPREVVKQRLNARQTEAQAISDADWEIYQRMEPKVEKITRKHYVVDTSRDVTPVIDKIVREALRQA